ncbi:nuclear transport factor 2 family protein [Actinoplanes sp. NPDC051513]|uniref:nuclear transport factor 2 family protein n=1 Tax=Actinoplanes sp. NPDC051513 TaxID=3363908 RepID=UPI0037B4DB32
MTARKRSRQHVERFNAAVRSGDWDEFLATLAPEAVMSFDGVPVGPFVGRDAIAVAYETNPPTDTMEIRDVEIDSDAEIVRFAWSKGGTGTLTIRRGAGGITKLAVRFD